MSTVKNNFIIEPFNGTFIAFFVLFIAILVIASLIMRNKSDSAKRAVIVTACIITLIGFFVYKYYLSIDAEFDAANQAMGGFNWWGELPLQLCNINMILIPIAVLTQKRPLLCFCFFVGPLGALMALLMPTAGFSGYSLLIPRMLGYYGTHMAIIIEALAIVTFGLFRPRFRDIPRTCITVIVIAFVIFIINLILRGTGLHPKANYFFIMETEGNPILEIFRRLIPLPYLYELPCIAVLAVYMSVITAFFTVFGKKDRKEE